MSNVIKVLVVGAGPSGLTESLIKQLKEAAVEVVNVGTEGHIDQQRCSKALQALGLSAEEAASKMRDFGKCFEPIRIHNFHGLEQHLLLKERKVEAPKPWERESWRRKKKGRT